MKKQFVILAAALIATSVFAQDKKAPDGKGIVTGDVTRMVSTVESIDQATREVTLKDKNGETITFVAGPDVKNLAQVRKGDIVTMDYIEAVALKLKKSSSGVRERTETEFKKGAAAGQMPAGIIGKEVKVVASVEAIDAKTGKVTLRGPKRSIKLVVKDAEILKAIKVGDMVEAEYTEALAVKVEKAPAAPAKK